MRYGHVIVEDELELVCILSSGATQGHNIIQCQITQKWYKIELYLQWLTDRKLYMIYWILLFSLTLNDP